MNKKRKVLFLIISAIAIVGIIVGGIFLFSEPKIDDNTEISDAVKFKKEYEELNDTIRQSDGAKYNNVSISENNPIKIVDAKGASEVLDKQNAVLYIGAGWCPWCRNAVPVLLDVAKNRDINTIYYLNLDDEKSLWDVVDGKAVKTKDGSKAYYELLEKLKDELTDYTLTGNKGKKLNTGEKRIYMPMVIAINDGKVVEKHVGTVELTKDQNKYSALTENQTKELYGIYNELFNKAFADNNYCTIDGECN